MECFNFHHHNSAITNGIYNLSSKEQFFPNFFSAGLHPQDIDANWPTRLEELKMIASEKSCVAIGECGLDALAQADGTLQLEIFLQQISLANQLGKPVVIHCVRRYQEINALKKHAHTPWVLHGFNRNAQVARQLLDAGFLLSFGKPLLYSLSLQQIFCAMPSEAFFLETDNADFNISELYEKAATLRKTDVENVENQIIKNLRFILND